MIQRSSAGGVAIADFGEPFAAVLPYDEALFLWPVVFGTRFRETCSADPRGAAPDLTVESTRDRAVSRLDDEIAELCKGRARGRPALVRAAVEALEVE